MTINPPCVPDNVLLKWCASLPVPSVAAAKAYLQFDQIQGKRGIWFCGAYEGNMFHEFQFVYNLFVITCMYTYVRSIYLYCIIKVGCEMMSRKLGHKFLFCLGSQVMASMKTD